MRSCFIRRFMRDTLAPMSERSTDILLGIHRGLTKQAPGDAEWTRRALEMCEELPDAPGVLDIGCGPGMHTIVLAEETGGHVTAVDLIWAEGSAYIMGFEQAYRSWRRLLRRGGYLAATELVWLEAIPDGDGEALELIEMTQREIDMRREHASAYGYEFFVARVTD